MEETEKRRGQKPPFGTPFQKGNTLAKGVKRVPYVTRCREFAEREGWDLLEKWARCRNPRASIAAITTIFAYGFGRPREQLRITGDAVSVQQWYVNCLRSAGGNGGPAGALVHAAGEVGPEMVLQQRAGSDDLGEAGRDPEEHA